MKVTTVTWAGQTSAELTSSCGRGDGSGFFGLRSLFDGHILEFTGLKDVAAFETLDVLGVLIAADNLHARVLTLIHDPSLLGELRRRLAS